MLIAPYIAQTPGVRLGYSRWHTRFNAAIVCALLLTGIAGCSARHGGPVIDTGDRPPEMSGTIAGTVRAAGSNSPLSSRRVIATHLGTGAVYDVTTAANGGYTLKVPMGRYRLQVDLQDGETVTESPGEIDINRSDLDAGRDFVIAMKRSI